MKNKVKLTKFSSGAGWACKLAPEDLSQVLRNLNIVTTDKTLIDYKSLDDASAYKLGNEIILQSVDFFTPIVDDPYDFGRIAAANSLSDIYAMGGEAMFALNIVGFPSEDLSLDILTDILRGGSEAFKTNTTIANSLKKGLLEEGLPESSIQLVETTDREAVKVLLSMD